MPTRHGFSLMEMILATAILAGSGAALFSLIANASQFARRAETRATALQLAQNLLNETAMAGTAQNNNSSQPNSTNQSDQQQPIMGEDSRWVYRLQQSPVTTSPVTTPATPGMIRVMVEVSLQSEPERPVCRLVRWVRQPIASESSLSFAPQRNATVPAP